MTKEVFLTILRQVLTVIGSTVGTKLAIDGDTMQALIAGLLALVAIIWGIVTKSKDVTKVAAATTVLEQTAPPVSSNQIAEAAAKVQSVN